MKKARLVEGDSNANNHALQQWYAEEHLWPYNTSEYLISLNNKANKYLIKCSMSLREAGERQVKWD